jgi:hypothetical protein
MATLDQLAQAVTIALDVENNRELSEDAGSIDDYITKYRKRVEFIRKFNIGQCVLCDIRISRNCFVEEVSDLL